MKPDDMEKVIGEAAGGAPGGRLPCARALGIARRLAVPPGEVGEAANRLEVRIVNCQLGFFVVDKATHDDLEPVATTGPLAEAIDAALVDGRLTCAGAFAVAAATRAPVKLVGDTATKKGIKIGSCQLGCFP